MPKRTRESEAYVAPPSLDTLPYSTIDGGRWLKKALDPVDIMTEVTGLPDINTNQRAILNYQMQDDIPVPRSETFNPNIVQSYDADLYLYQDPIVYGLSVSYPQSTKNPADYPITIDVNLNRVEDTVNVECVVKLASGTAPRTYNVYYNNQIEGSTVYEKLNSLQRYCQRSRIIYGGIQAIPACSALFDSGTIEATQQIFSPENKMITDLKVQDPKNYLGTPFRCQAFKPDDYPDEGSSIQNATSLYCRYKEGLYMPYKLVNPLVYPYKGSEEKCLTESPYIFAGVYQKIAFYKKVSGNTVTEYADFSYDMESNSYKATYSFDIATERLWGVQLYLECVSKFGQKFYFQVSPDKLDPNIQEDPFSGSFSLVLPKIIGSYPHETLDYIDQEHSRPVAPSQTAPDQNCTLRCNYVTSAPFNHNVIDQVNFMLPQLNSNIGIVCFRSIGLQASIRLIFRLGLEMMIVAGGVYSPFKHKSPNYDQRALNSYVRACHSMRDAFLGNAATPEGHADYAAHIAELVASDNSGSVSNMGSRWYGKVSL